MGRECGAFCGRRIEIEVSPELAQPRFGRGQPVAALAVDTGPLVQRAGDEPLAVVDDVEPHGAIQTGQRDDDPSRLGMDPDVGQRALRGAQQGDFDGRRQVREVTLDSQVGAYTGLVGKGVLETVQCLRQAVLRQQRGRQRADDAARLGEVGSGRGLDLGEQVGEGRGALDNRTPTRKQQDRGEPLSEGVVDVPGQPGPFLRGPDLALDGGEPDRSTGMSTSTVEVSWADARPRPMP